MKTDKKDLFIENLFATGGIIYTACKCTGISRGTYYVWYNSDADFRARVDEVMEAQIDAVESRLMERIVQGDTTATIFYLKTRGRNRGWNDKVQPQPPAPEIAPPPAAAELPGSVAPDRAKLIAKRVKNKKDYIVKLLKEQGKYTKDLSIQANIAAQLLVRVDMLNEEITADGYNAINVETSREGNDRRTINPKEKLYLDLLQQSQKALRALGMNIDAKDRKPEDDAFNDFLKEFKDD